MRRLLILVLLLATACGKKGSPSPPVPIVPMATSDLVVTQRGTTVLLTWTYPSTTTAGRPLDDQLRRISVFRFREELPASLAGKDPAVVATGDHDPTLAPEIALFSRVPAVTPAQFEKLREQQERLGREALAERTQGARVVFEIPAEFETPDGRPLRFTYAVVSETESGRSQTSNLVSLVPVEPPLPPRQVTIAASREGIELKWTPPPAGVQGGTNERILGYHVYRHDAANPESARTPITATLLKETSFRDSPSFGRQVYAVTAVASLGPPRIESNLSDTVAAEFRDLVAPPSPTGVVALTEDAAIQIVWESVESSELAGYNVYRVAGRERLKLTSVPVLDSVFRDERVKRGVTYVYEVTSVDRQGNESEPGRASEALIPTD